ncbi:energy-coupling factor transporter ATPase [Paraliobacillus ryukyuensis]|uniref:energy-coupling factor transporter ATPase n=1 Tax=Paraliobacillus ryukyuensis TaxID=200904 RepID=UPI0009A6E2C2|nr:energy-coupling factor transporter ATPase [Paraliobacillus ryukyuensis]
MQADQSILEVNNLTFRYDLRKDDKTLSAVSFSIKEGEWVAIVGDNGSGKSTLARLLVGLLEAESGEVKVAGVQLTEQTKWTIRQQMGLVFQNPENQFIGATVQDDVAFGLENNNISYQEMKQRVNEAVQLVNMEAFMEHDPSRLSGGQKQRVALAGILAFQPKIIILDEALVMLDPKSRRQVMRTLQQLQDEQGLTIISITHDMNEAAVADRLLVMDKGRLKQDATPATIFMENPHLEAPFAEQLRRKLTAKGSGITSTYMTEDEMVKWLCK